MKKTFLLPDVNVWIALTFDSHPHHPSAKSWFDVVANGMLFCRMSQQGFLRLSTNPSVAGAYALKMSEAWGAYDAYLNDPRISLAPEPVGLESQWRIYSRGESFSPKVWNDAYLAAFAKTADYELVTFDKGFARYPGLSLVLLQ